MPRTVTLAQLKADVLHWADEAGYTVRVAPTMLTRPLNQSRAQLREEIAAEGGTIDLEPYTGTLTAGNTSPFAFAVLTLAVPTAMIRTYSVQITDGTDVRNPKQKPFQEFEGGTDLRGRPRYWSHFKRDQIALSPSPDQAYPFVVWYLPPEPDLVSDLDTAEIWSSVEAEAWVWDCVVKSIHRSQYPQAYQTALQRRNEAWATAIKMGARLTDQGGASVGRDSFGRDLYAGRRSRLPDP